MKRTKVIDALKCTDFGQDICVKGWVRSKRGSKGIFFIALNDGSTIKNIQIVGEDPNFDEETIKRITTGACIAVSGTLVESPAAGQASEIQAKDIEILGDCDNTYPLQKKGASWEYLRTVAHLRPRTNTFGAILRIRHNMAMAIHTYFHEHGYFYFHTPLITASDCEGAGPDRQRSTRGRAGSHRSGGNIHLRSHFPCREQQHSPPFGRILDDRTRGCLSRPGRTDGPRGRFHKILRTLGFGQL